VPRTRACVRACVQRRAVLVCACMCKCVRACARARMRARACVTACVRAVAAAAFAAAKGEAPQPRRRLGGLMFGGRAAATAARAGRWMRARRPTLGGRWTRGPGDAET
jgi:hypothetical protein